MTKNALLICFALATTGFAADPQPSAATPRVGMNLSGFCDWSTELFFVDIFKTTRAWISPVSYTHLTLPTTERV